jgi:predicted RNA-binding Zn ribbon-like protein
MPGRQFYSIGNEPWLDFADTVMAPRGVTIDLLPDFESLVVWLRAESLLSPAGADAALIRWAGTGEATRVLSRALQLRADLRALAAAAADGGRIDPRLPAQLNDLLRSRRGYVELAAEATGGFRRDFHSESRTALALLAPIAESAVDFAVQAERPVIQRCQNPTCLGFFHDRSKNKRRKWCRMDLCGDRAKSAAYYRRSRSVAAGAA